jgi:hypothetical protein
MFAAAVPAFHEEVNLCSARYSNGDHLKKKSHFS